MIKEFIRATKLYIRFHIINFYINLSDHHVRKAKKYSLIARAMYNDVERRYYNGQS